MSKISSGDRLAKSQDEGQNFKNNFPKDDS